MAMLHYSAIKRMGFANIGKKVQISEHATFYNCANISLGNNCRIDDFCVLSAGDGGIEVGNYVHIAAYTSIIGSGRITISDYSNLSSRVSIYSSSDDYSGKTMTNPTIPSKYTGVVHSDVTIEKHVIIGCGSVVLPGVTLETGVAVGALSLVTKNCKKFGIYAGTPVRFIKKRKEDLLKIEHLFTKNNN